MSTDVQFVFALIALASMLFASGRVRFDVVACLVILALVMTDILTPEEAFSGFGNPVVVLLAALLIIAEMLISTGAAYAFGHWLSKRFGGSEVRLLTVLMLSAAFMGSIMSATAVVAVLLPAMLRVANKTGIPVSRLLLPLSYAALISGMLTLIGTPPNMIVAAQLEQSGQEAIGFFSFTPVGLGVLGLAIVYMLLLGRRMLPKDERVAVDTQGPGLRQMANDFGLDSKGRQYYVPPGSPIVGLRIKDSLLASAPFRLLVLQRSRKQGGQTFAVPADETLIKPGDTLFALPSDGASAAVFASAAHLQRKMTSDADIQRWSREVGVAKVLVHPDSRWIGKTLAAVEFRQRYHLQALALRKQGEVMSEDEGARLESGDSLLVIGSWGSIARLQATSHNFVVLQTPMELENYVPRHHKASVAFAIVVAMVVLLALDFIPMVITVLLAIGAGVFTGCMTMDDAYKSIPWRNIVLIAGMLPIALALQKTGGVDVIVDALVSSVGHYGPYAMMTALFCLCVALGFFLSNAATAVLMAPIAMRMADIAQVDPHAFVMTVAIAATAAFVTPNSTPVVSLVVGQGGYRFVDFLKVGSPLLLLTLAVTLLVLPLRYPF
jgi:di/tricarboxylate transporter